MYVTLHGEGYFGMEAKGSAETSAIIKNCIFIDSQKIPSHALVDPRMYIDSYTYHIYLKMDVHFIVRLLIF